MWHEIAGKIQGVTVWDQQFEDLLRQRLPYLPVDQEFTADLDLRDFGLDSLGVVELLSSLESAYSIRLADDALDLANFATPGVLWETVSRQRR